MAKVSICVPVYNNLEDVKRLLNSIEKQSYQDIEVIITDDSTNDEIMTYVSEKSYVRYIKNTSRLGHIYNWNEAINNASGEYIKIMFSDDWFTFEDSLQKMVDLLDYNPHVSMAFCGSRQTMLEDDADKLKRKSGAESFDRFAPLEYTIELHKDYRYLFISNQVGCPSATIYRRKKDNVANTFDEKSNWASDVFLYMDILKDNPNFVYTEEPLICVGMHANQYTEMFSERDLRIYNDYKYMYEKYNLKQERNYKEYFLNNYIIGYKQPISEAKEAGIGSIQYLSAKIKAFIKSIKAFLNYRLRIKVTNEHK